MSWLDVTNCNLAFSHFMKGGIPMAKKETGSPTIPVFPMLKTVEQMSKVSGIGENKLRELMDSGELVFEIPSLDIKVPVMDGTDNKILSVAAGHFENTRKVGSGNYCIAGHNSTIYAEIFNELDNIKVGTEMYLHDNDENKTCYTYEVFEKLIVTPEETWVLDDFDDDRITIITCTDDGTQRQVVIGIKK